MTASEANHQRVLALLAHEYKLMCEEAKTIEIKAPANRRGGLPLTSSDRRENFHPTSTSPTSQPAPNSSNHPRPQQV